MRILHTSDWHLGRIFHGVHLTDDQAHVLEQVVRLVADAKPDVLLIAGDVYDRSVPPTEAVCLLDEVLSRILLDHGVPVILIAGNHDSPERLGFGTRLLSRQGLHVVGQIQSNAAPLILRDSWGPVYFCPIPYAEAAVARNVLADADAADHNRAMLALTRRALAPVPPGGRAVVVAHAFVAGCEATESERPLSVGGANTVDGSCFGSFCYTALGHLHRPQCATADNVRYAGSLLKYSFSESAHRKSVNLVEIDGGGNITVKTITLTPRRDVRCLDGFLNDILKGPPPEENRNDYLMVTLRDTGAIMDAIGKLRAIYPNVLHIERPHLAVGGELGGPGGDHRRLSEVDLFASFFEQVTGDALASDQKEVFAETAEAVQRRDREVQP